MSNEKKRFLKSVIVNFISLVDKGANQKKIIFKSADTAVDSYQKIIELKKVDNDQRLVYGIVYSPDEVDTEGDFTTAEVIKQMAYDFMKDRNTNNIDQQHDFNPDEGFVAESWILEKNDPRFPDEKEGSWAVAIKISNEDTWAKVKSGEITGLSMAGLAQVEDIAKDSKEKEGNGTLKSLIMELIKQFKTAINELSNNSGEHEMKPEEVTQLIKESITEAMKPLEELQKTFNELNANMENKNAEIEKRLTTVEKAAPGSAQLAAMDDVTKNRTGYKGPNWLS